MDNLKAGQGNCWPFDAPGRLVFIFRFKAALECYGMISLKKGLFLAIFLKFVFIQIVMVGYLIAWSHGRMFDLALVGLPIVLKQKIADHTFVAKNLKKGLFWAIFF